MILALKSFCSNTIHAAGGPIQFGVTNIACCGKMKWNSMEADRMLVSKNPDDVTCVSCQDTTYFESVISGKLAELDKVAQAEMDLMSEHFAQTLSTLMKIFQHQVATNPIGCKIAEKYVAKKVDEAKSTWHAARWLGLELKRLTVRNTGGFGDPTALLFKDTPEAAGLVHGISLIFSKELALRSYAEHVKRMKDQRSKRMDELSEELQEIKKDLAEAEEANEKLIGENDSYREKLNRVHGVLNDNDPSDY